ncbi:glycoside hydrolase family 2 protein [Paenibacillus chibensis]|uniref:glycoside hydrolase family 2 protein n=1 Tax=Paenibacillus chibensis TaxID=59846 RepID=UPI001FE695E3|nr:sugar-binding domain-containing protein [Paenibacillus chibensis]MEC0369770.1 glycoside hydrolase family 2 TIM barrel-domain containing protein [Paenibacillus chibensis]
MNHTIPRPEYPRPQWQRREWMNLNGAWSFAFDDERRGDAQHWYQSAEAMDRTITVPYTFQSKLSGIADPDFHDLVWYRRHVKLPESWSGKRVILHFGAVDYSAKVWVNGQLDAMHEGGHTPFEADITDLIAGQDNVITVRAEDYSRDVTLPRGKQFWEEDSASIFYTRTTGIWQTVWLEAVDAIHIRKVKFTPDLDRNEIRMQMFLSPIPTDRRVQVRIKISYQGTPVKEDVFTATGTEETRCIALNGFNHHGFERWWSPEHPNLYDVSFDVMHEGKVVDEVSSYFGMRKISIESGKLCLNNRPYELRLVLDQGYWPESLLTAPEDDSLIRDIDLTKEMGFNGVRRHQKMEDPRFLYWADRKGLLVWGESANAYDYSEAYVQRFTREWQEVIERDYNHPCIMAWVPLNESWGVPNIQVDAFQQHHGLAMYHMIKSLDQTRPVIFNDGWEMVKTDIVAIHDYEWQEQVLSERYESLGNALASMPADRQIFVGGGQYEGQPILITEFGGIAYKKSDWDGWGYSGAENDEDYLKRLQAVVGPLHRSPIIQGFCYTQLTDVEQEINGLLTYDRVPKVPLEQIRRIVLNSVQS